MHHDLYCEVCDRDASEQCVLARWRDMTVCTECLCAHAARVAEGLCEDA
jgi:hypothetical protein